MLLGQRARPCRPPLESKDALASRLLFRLLALATVTPVRTIRASTQATAFAGKELPGDVGWLIGSNGRKCFTVAVGSTGTALFLKSRKQRIHFITAYVANVATGCCRRTAIVAGTVTVAERRRCDLRGRLLVCAIVVVGALCSRWCHRQHRQHKSGSQRDDVHGSFLLDLRLAH